MVDLHRPDQLDRKLLPCRISSPRSLNPSAFAADGFSIVAGALSLRNCHGGFRAAWLQRFVFAPENRHLDDVPIATVLKVVLAPPTFLDETAFPIASDSARVELEYAELDPIQIHLIEGEAKQSISQRRIRSRSTSTTYRPP